MNDLMSKLYKKGLLVAFMVALFVAYEAHGIRLPWQKKETPPTKVSKEEALADAITKVYNRVLLTKRNLIYDKVEISESKELQELSKQIDQFIADLNLLKAWGDMAREMNSASKKLFSTIYGANQEYEKLQKNIRKYTNQQVIDHKNLIDRFLNGSLADLATKVGELKKSNEENARYDTSAGNIAARKVMKAWGAALDKAFKKLLGDDIQEFLSK